ncbi:MAG: DUF5658 family protein [Myxococcota bacterium]
MSLSQAKVAELPVPSFELPVPSFDLPRFQGVGTEGQFQWLRGVLLAVLILNLADAFLTLHWVSSGMAVEANPLLAELVTESPLLFVATKMSLVGLGSILLWRNRQRGSSVVAIFAMFIVYYLLLLYHLQAFQLGLGREVERVAMIIGL